MSNSPTPEANKSANMPARKSSSSAAPYAEMIEILRSVHCQAERDRLLHPNDSKAEELERALRYQIDDLEISED